MLRTLSSWPNLGHSKSPVQKTQALGLVAREVVWPRHARGGRGEAGKKGAGLLRAPGIASAARFGGVGEGGVGGGWEGIWGEYRFGGFGGFGGFGKGGGAGGFGRSLAFPGFSKVGTRGNSG